MNESRKQKYFSTVATRSEKVVGLQKLRCSGFDLVIQMIGFIFGRRSEKKVFVCFCELYVYYHRVQPVAATSSKTCFSVFVNFSVTFFIFFPLKIQNYLKIIVFV